MHVQDSHRDRVAPNPSRQPFALITKTQDNLSSRNKGLDHDQNSLSLGTAKITPSNSNQSQKEKQCVVSTKKWQSDNKENIEKPVTEEDKV